jgi:hypothetical protein
VRSSLLQIDPQVRFIAPGFIRLCSPKSEITYALPALMMVAAIPDRPLRASTGKGATWRQALSPILPRDLLPFHREACAETFTSTMF